MKRPPRWINGELHQYTGSDGAQHEPPEAPTVRKAKPWMLAWLVFGLYFIIAAMGRDAGIAAAMAMFCGFMVARNVADMVPSNG